MIKPSNPIRFMLALWCAGAATAQVATPNAVHRKPRVKAYQPPYNPDVVVLDPAHGGGDEGAKLGNAGSEKDFNLAFADRLRTLLTAQGFTVVATRTPQTENVTGDQRAELANRSHAVACLLLHAANTATGVHLFTSALTPASDTSAGRTDSMLVPWEAAQAGSLAKSIQLAGELATAMNGLRVPLAMQRISVSPIDSMVCPAVGLELAPARAGSGLDDEVYEQHVAEAVVTALTFWRQHARDQILAAETAGQAAAGVNGSTPAPELPKPKPKPRPAIVKPPDEEPLLPERSQPTNEPANQPRKPAPIERRPPVQKDAIKPSPGVQP